MATYLDDLYPTGEASSGMDALSGAQSEAPQVSPTIEELYPTGGAEPATALDAAKEAALGTAEGILTSSPTVGGAIAGGRIGAAALSPLGPWGTALGAGAGALIGGAGGYFLGEKAAESVIPPVDQTELVPYREGGKTFGQAIGAAPAAFYLPVSSANRVSKFLSGIGEFARKSPKSYLAGEITPGIYAGIAGGTAEAYDPGDKGTRLLAETGAGIAGMLSPARMLFASASLITDQLKKGFGALTGRGVSEAAKESKAANKLLAILNEAGEDVPQLISRLRQELPTSQLPGDLGKVTPTSAQKTGSGVLTMLENWLAKGSARFGADTYEQGKDALRAHQMVIDRLRQVGSPDALYLAAEAQKQQFEGMLEQSLALADAKAAEAIANISKDTPAARAQIGEIVKSQTQEALRAAREHESSLWNRALQSMRATSVRKVIDPKTLAETTVANVPQLKPTNTVQDFLEYASTLGDAVFEKNTPAVVKAVMAKFGVTPQSVKAYKEGLRTEEFVTTGMVPDKFIPKAKDVDISEIVNYRSNLLKMARDAASAGDSSTANFYSTMADSMMKDLDQVKNPALDDARQFSRLLNDVFTRTFAKTASEGMDVTKTGAQRLPAEVLVSKAFGSNADLTSSRMTDIEDAVKFMSTQYDNAVKQFGADSPQALLLEGPAKLAQKGVASVTDAHARVLRLAAASAIDRTFDPATGREVTRLNVKKLQRFTDEFRPMLDKLGLTADLAKAETAENAFRMVQNQNSALMQRAADQYAWGEVLKANKDRPSVAIGAILRGANPVQGMRNLVGMAQTGGEAAVRGLKSSAYDYLYTKASSGDGLKFSPQNFEKSLFDPIAPNKPSLARILTDSGVMSFSEIKNIRRILNPMIQIEQVAASRRMLENPLPASDAISELGQRMLGAHVGSAIAPSGPGSLIAASAGSQAVRKMFDKLPAAATRVIFERAAQDPQFMALLLQKGSNTPAEKLRLARSLHSYMVSSGLNYATFDEPPPEPQRSQAAATFTAQGQSARALRALPAAPSTRGVSFTGGKAAPQSPPAGQGPSAVPGGARSALQSLFPFDTISSMFRGSAPPQ